MEPGELRVEASGRLGSCSFGDPDREHLVLIHGFSQSGRSWRRIAEDLAEHFHVTTIDLPGHGRSTDMLATDLIETALMVGNTGGQSSYIGYSLGARVCLALACLRPDLVERLVLISGSPGIGDPTERRERAEADDALADRLDPQDRASAPIALTDFLDEWLAGPLFRHLSVDQADRGSRLVNTARGLAHSLRSAGVGRQLPLHDRLGGLSMPVCCVAGVQDTRYLDAARAMTADIGENAEVRTVENAGHAVPFEQPAATLALLRTFLAQPIA